MLHHPKEKVKAPRNLRSARRSLVKNQISTPLTGPTTYQSAIAAPKKIIKALYDYKAQGPHELSFSQGDFFLVSGRENDDKWFEASNPATNSKGLVPVNYFQVLDKTERNLPVAQPQTQELDPHEGELDHFKSSSRKSQPLYGVVLYDFQAERFDELDAKAGEPIIVIAQSNEEWFVAKPIGRLGGPGLIPVSFVEVRDAVTGRPVTDGTQAAAPNIPRVEEWKKMTQGYEASTIQAGSQSQPMATRSGINASPISSVSSNVSDRYANHHEAADDYFGAASFSYDNRPESILDSYGMQHLADAIQDEYSDEPKGTPYYASTKTQPSDSKPIVVSAAIDSYILEGDQYWFIVYARLNNGRFRVLYRLYEDFHDFQINLLHEYPVEAGKSDRERILPYMPGPLTTVDEEITAERQKDLDQYCRELLSLPRYLAESDLVQKQLFGIHEGDIETDRDPRLGTASLAAPKEAQPQFIEMPTGSITPGISSNVSTTTSAVSTPPISTSRSMVKIKIVYGDEIFAIKMQTDTTLDMLHAKVYDRLGFNVRLRYKDDISGDSLPLEDAMDMENAFTLAIKNGKLTVYATRI